MNTRHQRTLIAIFENPTRANINWKDIESLFDVKLFRRQGRGMAMTHEGRALMPRCQTVLGEVGAMGSALQGTVQPAVRIGAFPHTAATVLPEIIKKLINVNPMAPLQKHTRELLRRNYLKITWIT